MRNCDNYDKEMKKKLKNLINILEIVNSKFDDEIKAILICKIYDSSYKFIEDYIEVYKYYENNDIFLTFSLKFDFVYEVFVNYEELGLISKANYCIMNEKYRENLDFCRMVINDYIQLGSSYNEKEFLEMLGISKKTFDFCIKVIKQLDIELYKYFLKMKEYNKVLYCEKNIQIIKELAYGISNGFFEDGTEFNLLEFIIRVPFKLEGFFCGAIEKFMKDNDIYERGIVSKYIHDNKLNGRQVFHMLEVWELYSGDIYVGGHKMTSEDNDIILKYMIQNELPFIRKVYNIIRTKYLTGEITKDDVMNHKEFNSYNKLLKKKYASYLKDVNNLGR